MHMSVLGTNSQTGREHFQFPWDQPRLSPGPNCPNLRMGKIDVATNGAQEAAVAIRMHTLDPGRKSHNIGSKCSSDHSQTDSFPFSCHILLKLLLKKKGLLDVR